jgi:hypothetical protein
MLYKNLVYGIACFFVFAAKSGAQISPDTLKMICQQWKIADLYSDNINLRDTADMAAVESMKRTARFEFKNDLTYLWKTEEETIKGTWNYDPGTNAIIYILEGEKIPLKIISISGTKLKWESRHNGVFTSMTLVPAAQ